MVLVDRAPGAPRRLGKYVLYESIGVGSMGNVHRARSFGPGGVVKDLCVKRIRAKRLTRPGALECFVKEARLSMRLAHGNIVPVFDFGRAGDEYFLAMEWVEGANLLQILRAETDRAKTLPPAVSAHVAAEVARALDYAHSLDEDPIVHRDIKPANVLISRAGEVRLTDFGIAVVAGDSATGIGGTPGYMAPEQWASRPVDGRCDIFSLGRILLEMLLGHLPDAEDPDALDWSGVPAELLPLLRAMLSPKPADRPERACDVADALEGFVARARAAGALAPRSHLAERAAGAANTREVTHPDHEPAAASGEGADLEPELSYRLDGEDPAFVTQMTAVFDAQGKAVAGDAAEPPSRSPADGERERFGRYEIGFELASGGMASVCLARVVGPGGFEKLVALKRIHPHLARDTAFVEMFLDEARIASRINHPNVCSVFDFGRVDGVFYIAMEYVLGETVGDVIKKLAADRPEWKSRRWPSMAARIVADACEGLHAAHELKGNRGETLHLIHRDFTPQNLFVAYDGHVVIVDFGIARAAGRLHRTRTGALKGKLAYISPEQCRRLELDRRVDVWAAGIVLWELLTCRNLFRRDSDPDTLLAVVDAPIDPPSKFQPAVPPELDAVVLRALSRDRDERFQTARELGRALNRVIAGSEDPVTSADVAEWMERVFAAEHAHRRELTDHVRGLREGPVADLHAPLVEPVEAIGADPHPPEALIDHAPTRRWKRKRREDPSSTDLLPGRPGWRRRHIAIALSLLFALGVILGIAVISPEGDEPPAARSEPPSVGAEGVQATGVDPVTSTRAEPTTLGEAEPAGDEAAPDGLAEEEGGGEGLVDQELVAEGLLEATTALEEETDTAAGEGSVPRSTHRRPGRVSIATPGGWADVLVGNRRVGRAPGEIRLRPGRYRIRLLPFGREPAKTAFVRVGSGARVRLIVPLQR